MFSLILFILAADIAEPKPRALTDSEKLTFARMEIQFLRMRAEAAETELAALKKRDQLREQMSAAGGAYAERVKALAGRAGCITTDDQEISCPAPVPTQVGK